MEDYLENESPNQFMKVYNRVEFEITAEKLDGASTSIAALPRLQSENAGFRLVLVVYNKETENDDLEDIVDNSLGALYDQFLESVFGILTRAKEKQVLNSLL